MNHLLTSLTDNRTFYLNIRIGVSSSPGIMIILLRSWSVSYPCGVSVWPVFPKLWTAKLQKLKKKKIGKVYGIGVHTFSKCAFCGFSYHIGLGVHLLQSWEHDACRHCLLCFVKHSPVETCFMVEVVHFIHACYIYQFYDEPVWRRS
jgi:hypothetical protein